MTHVRRSETVDAIAAAALLISSPPGVGPTPGAGGNLTAEEKPGSGGVRPTLRGWIHLAAFVVVIALAPFVVIQARNAGSTLALVVYAVSLIGLFGVSAAFHRLSWSPRARRRMQRADHTMIFLAIAGTYTAVAGLALGGATRALVLCLVWAGAGVGIVLRQVWLAAPKWVVALPYLVAGWAVLLVAAPLFHSLGVEGFVLLALGGVFYTSGAVVYARHRPDPWPGVFGYHEVFHACTVVGASLHLAVVVAFALPLA